MTDVLILAGGRGTRIKGLWDGPKCLVPVGGVPLLERLLNAVAPLKPQYVTLALGVKAPDVQRFVRKLCLHVVCCVDSRPHGTAAAVRRAVKGGYVGAPLLVLNGDTLPLYDLGALIAYHESRIGAWATVAVTHDAVSWRDAYAGACVLSPEAVAEIVSDDLTNDLRAHLIGAHRFAVPDFLCVGTRDRFQRAKEWQGG